MDPTGNTRQPDAPEQETPSFRPATPAQPVTAAPVGDDPGKTLGIVGIILAFFFALVGLILSIISRKRSVTAGFSGTLGTVGIILNVVFLLLNVVAIGIMAAIIIVAYNGVSERAQEAKRQSEQQEQQAELYETQTLALSINKKAEAYYAFTGSYPTNISQFTEHDESRLTEDMVDALISTGPLSADSDAVHASVCGGGTGFTLEYWSPSANAPAVNALGTATVEDTANCTPLALSAAETPAATS